jgi:hypothetical protein
MANKYILHQGVTVSCAFTVNGVATDPTTVTLRIIDPEAVETIYTEVDLVKDPIIDGRYSKLIPGEKLGTWFYEWVGTGACIASYQFYYQIVSYME